jgi:WD40 repeat protein
MAFSPGGKIFAAAFDNPMLRLWDVATWQPLGPSLGAQLAGRCVAFSPNGKLLAVGRGDGTVVIWNIDLDSWGETLCSIANRNLSLDEWQQFIGPEVRYHRTCPNLPSGNGVAEK